MQMRKCKLVLFIFSICLLMRGYWPDVYAEPSEDTEDPTYRQKLGHVIEEKEEDFPYELDSYVRYMPSRGARSQAGKVAVTDSASEFSYDFKAFGKLPVEFAAGTRYIGIHNTTGVKLPARLTQVSAGVETTLPFFFDKTYFTLGAAPSFYTDNWNLNSASFRIPQRYFFIYQPDQKWIFICGVGVFPGFEDVVVPILGFIYKPDSRLTFNIVPSRPEITYALNDKLTLLLEAEISEDEFEVDKDNLKNVVLEYNEMHLGTGFKYQINKYIKSSVSAGCIFNRSIKYRDENLGKVGIKNGLYTELRLDISI